MSFIADLHIHSRFSRATSKSITPAHLAGWGACKGIDVVGTGDFTHPQWRKQLETDLVWDESTGFFRLNGALWERERTQHPLSKETMSPLFCLQAEIASIYKRNDRVHKVHNLVFVRSLEDAAAFSRRLEAIGNLAADGRPILGLDSRDLLEMLLETCPDGVLVPAHIWTPWFSVFGSRSGFDSLEECFGDLTDHIFALETGLSSDPAMNRLISALDNRVLISNSDAHSGPNLGREANLFDGPPSYDGMFAALRASARRSPAQADGCVFRGTLEFFPEEGKYHLDGHRNCGIVVDPASGPTSNVCPVCGKPLTLGVLHRVMELADRSSPPELSGEPQASHLVPLVQVISEILQVGPTSHRVQERYTQLVQTLGPELSILTALPVADIRRTWDSLGEAIHRMRCGDVIKEGGFDGQYGTIRVFARDERREMGRAVRRLPGLGTPATDAQPRPRHVPSALPVPPMPARQATAAQPQPTSPDGLSASQRMAMQDGPCPVLVLAGPGAGKTRTLVGRLMNLLENGTPPEAILCLTFTRRAAGEIRDRLRTRPTGTSLPTCDTLHGYGWKRILAQHPDAIALAEESALALFRTRNPDAAARTLLNCWREAAMCRETLSPMPEDIAQRHAAYQCAKETAIPRMFDFTDILEWLLAAPLDAQPIRHVLVDEVQDLSPIQLAIVRKLTRDDGQGFFGIGDPDQAIYGFRGASGVTEETLRGIWPTVHVHRLAESFRAGQGVLDMARQLLKDRAQCGALTASRPIQVALRFFDAPNPGAEASHVARIVSKLLGSTSHTMQDATHSKDPDALDELEGQLAPSDIAILVRLKVQIPPLLAALQRTGVPALAPGDADISEDPLCSRLLALVAERLSVPWPKVELCASLPWQDPLPEPSAMTEWISGQHWPGVGIEGNRAWRQLCSLWKEQQDWRHVLGTITWTKEAELARARAEHVQVMTMHSSKGLEFKVVFLPGLEDGILPLSRRILYPGAETAETVTSGRETELEEERRLLYVGVTRASHALVLSSCRERSVGGRTIALAPSPLLEAIRGMCRQAALARKRTVMRQMSLPIEPSGG